MVSLYERVFAKFSQKQLRSTYRYDEDGDLLGFSGNGRTSLTRVYGCYYTENSTGNLIGETAK